jgi:hypothetical protein
MKFGAHHFPDAVPAAPPPLPAQPSRRAGQSLSLRSFGDLTLHTQPNQKHNKTNNENHRTQ